MPNNIQNILTVLARLMLCGIFFLSAVGNKIPNFSGTVEAMTGQGVPVPNVMLAGAIVFLIVGSLSIIVGFKARIGATLLFVFLALATYFFHDFWAFEGEEAMQQQIQFMKNVSLGGALLFILANGSGPMSLDNRQTADSPSE